MKFSRIASAVVTAAASLFWLSGAQASDALVGTDWLEKNLNNPQVRVI